MNKYKIKITYQTGHSLHSEVSEDYIDLTWDNLENAKKNLKYIKEHWAMYEELTTFRMGAPTMNEILVKYEDKPWFVDGGDSFYSKMRMRLEADNGNLMQQLNFWCGYFEHLHSAEIEIDDSDLKFTT